MEQVITILSDGSHTYNPIGYPNPITDKGNVWRNKVDRIIASEANKAYHAAQTAPNGKRYKYHHPYTLPQVIIDLVECLNTNDEVRAKDIFQGLAY